MMISISEQNIRVNSLQLPKLSTQLGHSGKSCNLRTCKLLNFRVLRQEQLDKYSLRIILIVGVGVVVIVLCSVITGGQDQLPLGQCHVSGRGQVCVLKRDLDHTHQTTCAEASSISWFLCNNTVALPLQYSSR